MGRITVIKASCPFGCGDVRLSIEEVTIRICLGTPGGEYRWHCKCGIVVKPADQHIVDVLRSSGVNEEVWELPLELIERPVGGNLTEDAIIDLELAFQDGSVFDKIVRKY